MTSTIGGHVDPPPIRPPALGLIPSARLPITGNSYDPSPDVLPPGEETTATQATIPVTEDAEGADSDWETPRIGAPVKWIRGYAYRPQVCNGGDTIDQDDGSIGTAPGLEDVIEIRPFVVEGVDKRSTMGTPTDGEYEEARGFAHDQLLACEGKQIEQVLWTGILTSGTVSPNRHLTSPTVNLVEGDRLLGLYTAMAALEWAIKNGTCGGQGMIHARADTISLWDQSGMLRRAGNLILTVHDTIVVPGAGYDGSGPDLGTPHLDPNHAGNPPGPRRVPSTDSAWAYATSIVDVRRSDFLTPQNLLDRVDYPHNILTTYERRIAAASWGCLHVGVHVDHINAISTTGS